MDFRCGGPEASDTIFQPTTHNSCSLVRLTGSLAVPALLYVVVKPIHAALSRQRSRVRVSSSPPFLFRHLQNGLHPSSGTKRDHEGIGSWALRRLFASKFREEESNDSCLRGSLSRGDRLSVGV